MTPLLSFEPFVSTAKESPAYWLWDILWVVHATGEQTQGTLPSSKSSAGGR